MIHDIGTILLLMVTMGFIGIIIWLLNRKACIPQRLYVERDINVYPDRHEIRMLILGDTGSGSADQRQIADASARTCSELGCDLALLAGDNFIQNGVSGLDDAQFSEKFESVYQQPIPFYAVLGNHDLRGDWRAQIAYTNLSSRWTMPDINYQFEAGPVFVQAINSAASMFSLWTLFKKTTKPWRVMFCHRPFVTNGRHPGMTWLERLFVIRSGIRVVFSGHNAGLEHLRHKGVDQIVSGGGGTSLPKFVDRKSPDKRFHLHDFGYVWVHFTDERVEARYFNREGNEVYRFEKMRC